MNHGRYIMSLLVLALSSDDVRADGGIMRVREVQGPFVVTIFTASELLQDGPVDVSVMVQERNSNDAILDANVNLIFTPPAVSMAEPIEQICGVAGEAGLGPHSEKFTVAATRRQASNKLLYAAPVKFGAAGNWQLQAFIQRESDAVKIACRLQVGPPPRKLLGLFPYLIFPPLMVAVFALNQRLRRQLWEKRIGSVTGGRDGSPSRPPVVLAGAVTSARRPYQSSARLH
jgi:hypothetical protein